MNRFSIHTQFIGQQLIYHPVCPSTNTEALQLISENKAREGAVVITDHQTAGRGQRDNRWESEAGQNLTFSVVLYPDVPVSKQFYLTTIAALAVTDALRNTISKSVKIKWPNDILCMNNKLCGILIQNNLKVNKIQSTVIGIGININQTHFSYPHATSLSLISGKTIVREEILLSLLNFLEKRYVQLRKEEFANLMSAYLERLYWLQEKRRFADQYGEFEGIIRGVHEDGQLQVWTGDRMRSYNFKEIKYVGSQ